jgi:hypothetical protein
MRWTWVLALMLVACTMPGAARKPAVELVTPSEARQIVTDYWTQNEKANVSGDGSLFETIESGPALTFDQAAAARNAKLNRHLAEARPLRKLTVYVPHQSRFPAEFAARIDTVTADRNGKPTTQPLSLFNVFEKASAGQAWKSSFFAQAAPSETITIPIGDDGYAAQVPIGGSAQAVPPGRMGQLVADYVNAVTAGMGVDDLELDGAPGIEAVARGQKLSIEGARRAGFTLTFQSAPGPGGAHAYRAVQDKAVVFFTVSSVQVVAAARDGACLVQDQRHGLPPEVPPGSYGRVENKILALVIAFDPPAKKGKATVVGMTATDYDFKVEPASGPCIDSGPPPATV